MRSVILVCVFNAGLPILNYCLSACMLFHYISDTYSWEHLYRVQREGAELPRALEFTLLFPGKSVEQSLPHIEAVHLAIE